MIAKSKDCKKIKTSSLTLEEILPLMIDAYKQNNYSFIVRFLDIWTNLHKIGGYLTLHWDGLVL